MGLGELSILSHVSLTAAVQEFKYGPADELATFFCPNPQPTDGGDSFKYDVLKADRDMAAPTVAGAPSKRVALQAVDQKSGRCIHVKEHKALDGDTLANLRQAGNRRREVAQRKIGQELMLLQRRSARLRNYAVAQMLTGTLAISEDDVKASIDYDVDSTHKPTASASWATSGTDIPTDIRTWKRLVMKDSGYTPTHAWCNEGVMAYLMANTAVKEYLGTGAYKAQIGATGQITEFMGLTWHVYDLGYIPSGGSFTRYIADDKVVLTPDPDGQWCNLQEGSTMIHPYGETDLVEAFGKHAYSLFKDDPAGVQIHTGDVFFPCLYIPDAVVYADVTP